MRPLKQFFVHLIDVKREKPITLSEIMATTNEAAEEAYAKARGHPLPNAALPTEHHWPEMDADSKLRGHDPNHKALKDGFQLFATHDNDHETELVFSLRVNWKLHKDDSEHPYISWLATSLQHREKGLMTCGVQLAVYLFDKHMSATKISVEVRPGMETPQKNQEVARKMIEGVYKPLGFTDELTVKAKHDGKGLSRMHAKDSTGMSNISLARA